MSAIENKQLMQQVFAELAKGNGKPFVDAMADDFRWRKSLISRSVLNRVQETLYFSVVSALWENP
jgi:hypothetical protein